MKDKLGNKNVNVEETNYFTAQKYLTMKGKLAFYWLIVLVRMTTPISSHVKDKNVTLSARGDYFFFERRILEFHQYLQVYNKKTFLLS